jgi:hypothetical protein
VETFDRLYGQEDEARKARPMAFSTKRAGSWLEALPTEAQTLEQHETCDHATTLGRWKNKAKIVPK